MITNRVKRYITKALEASLMSDYHRIKIGAVIVDGNYIVASASNTRRSHPRQAQFNSRAKRLAIHSCLHAEVHALIRSGRYDLSGTELYVGRFDRTGKFGNCKPCLACQMAIKDAGINVVYYTTPTEGIKHYEVI
jgi:deoxycytidylate deaminase